MYHGGIIQITSATEIGVWLSIMSPTSVNQINAIENIQRKFTKHITGMHSLPYENKLKHLKLYSLQRRRDRYIAIYIYEKSWKELSQTYHPPYV